MRLLSRFANRILALLTLVTLSFAQTSTPAASSNFAPLQQWKAAIISGNTAALKALYSINPPAKIGTPAGETNADSDITFWTGLKVRRMKLDILQSELPKTGLHQVIFQAEILSGAPAKEHTVYISEGQLWQQQSPFSSTGAISLSSKHSGTAKLPAKNSASCASSATPAARSPSSNP